MPRTPRLFVRPGDRFGLLTVVDADQRASTSARGALCNCECGGVTVAPIKKLRAGTVTSCGCRKRKTHGVSRHQSYKRWWAMLDRCENPESSRYRDYGARGISVCDDWHNPVTFVDWLDANLGPCPPAHTLDRIDNHGNCEPGNVRWAAAAEQAANRRPARPRKAA